ncbi:MAG: LacI family transcriptional regulator [Lachnospiraceae bacterium]|nr:LacI family transcriptional regulator [Lachnospiraceae bacterium]
MRRKIKQSITLKDIAEKTGYSVNTVSRALREKDDIAEETIERIKKVAKELGYVNNTIASSLRLGYTNTLAVIIGDISNPHFAIMTKEIENHARLKGYSSILLNTNEDKDIERQAITMAIHKNVDGIIICPTQIDNENLEYLESSNIPFIQIGRRTYGKEYNYVVCDDEKGGYIATKHLIENGHKRILFLNGPEYVSSAKERYDGYRKAIKEAGLPFDEALVRDVDLGEDSVENALEEIFGEDLQFTAIFAFSDMIAWRVWDWLDKRGFSIPEDYSIVGFDFIQSRMRIPTPLTTISSYKMQMSITAVDCILKVIQDENEDKFHKVIGTTLVQGRTVKKL